MYTFYFRDTLDHTNTHIALLFVNFDKACDELERIIRIAYPNFIPPNRQEIKETMDKFHSSKYYISDCGSDIYIIRDLPVVE